MIDGALEPKERAAIEEHLSGCEACLRLLATFSDSVDSPHVAPSESAQSAESAAPSESGKSDASGKSDEVPASELLSRYQVSGPIGAGGMGVVYSAWDPQLGRPVALKLLRAELSARSDSKSRVLREARAMARLKHPNVVAIYDVGTWREQVFIAMEFVEGGTLRKWLAAKPRRWREIVAVFVQAGRGLSAAHQAGLVHRDFKPDNVLVSSNGRVLVTDFGMARFSESSLGLERPVALTPVTLKPLASEATPLLSPAHDAAKLELERSLIAQVAELSKSPSTQTGAVVGSPAYMSPEQMRGEKVDPRADQFSFCVALYEALYGERPFAGEDLRGLAAEIAQERIREEPEGTRAPVPQRIRRVVRRGLAFRAGARFPSLDELLDALLADPAVRWRKLGAVLGAIALVVGSALLMRWQGADSAQACSGADEKLRGVWDDAARAKAKATFAATSLPYAQTTWVRVQKALDRYASDWASMRTEACLATAVKRTQPPELLDLRMACLDDRLRSLGAAGALMQSADNEVISRAVNVLDGLPELARCADANALRALDPPAPAERAQVDELSTRLARAQVTSDAGKPAVALLQEVVDGASKLGYAPLQANALYHLGMAQQRSGDSNAARHTYEEATAAALAAKLDDTLAAAWINLVGIDIELSMSDAAEKAIPQAQAALSRLGDAPPERAFLLSTLARLARSEDRLEEAQRDSEQAALLMEKLPQHNGLQINVLNGLAEVLGDRALWPQALQVQERAFNLAVSIYGPDHPYSGDMEGELGMLLLQLGKGEEGRQHLEHSLAVFEGALGPEHVAVAEALGFLGNSLIASNPTRAIELLRRALHIREAHPSDDAAGVVSSRWILGRALHAQGELKPAERELTLALALRSRLGGPDDLEATTVATELASVLIDEGKLKPAQALLDHALSVQEKGYGPEHPVIANTCGELGRIALEEKRFPAARRQMERALSIARREHSADDFHGMDYQLLLAETALAEGHRAKARQSLEQLAALPSSGPDAPWHVVARGSFLLARLLGSNPADQPRAQKLAEKSAASYAAHGVATQERAEVERWLGNNRTIEKQ